MFRAILVLSLLSTLTGVSGCRESKPLQPPPGKPPVPKTPPATTPAKAPPPPVEVAAVDLHRRWEITVMAGSLAREDIVVSALLPGTPAVKSAQVRAPNGARVPSQMQGDGRVAFRIKTLKAAAQAVYLVQEEAAATALVKRDILAAQTPEGVALTIDGRPILTYRIDRRPGRSDVAPEYWRNGYLHPLYSPAGVMVTDDYPKDKPYQHGIWSGWQKVEFGSSHPDFWDSGRKKGRVGTESVGPLWGGPLCGGFGSHQFFTDLDGRPGTTALREGWSVNAFRGLGRASYFVVDLESNLEALNGQILLQENPWGGINIRGNRDWQGADKSVFLTSEGQARAKAQGQAAHWCYLGGKSGGKPAGVAILAHPQNTTSPEGLFIDPEDPAMGFAPSKNGPLTLRPGRLLNLKYRFVVLDGKPDSKLFDRLWNDFASPPEVSVRLLGSK